MAQDAERSSELESITASRCVQTKIEVASRLGSHNFGRLPRVLKKEAADAQEGIK